MLQTERRRQSTHHAPDATPIGWRPQGTICPLACHISQRPPCPHSVSAPTQCKTRSWELKQHHHTLCLPGDLGRTPAQKKKKEEESDPRAYLDCPAEPSCDDGHGGHALLGMLRRSYCCLSLGRHVSPPRSPGLLFDPVRCTRPPSLTAELHCGQGRWASLSTSGLPAWLHPHLSTITASGVLCSSQTFRPRHPHLLRL